MAFANYGNQVALLRVVNGVMQGIQPVGNFHILGVRVALGHAGFDVRDNIFHFFKAVVVFGQDAEIRQLGAHFAHAVTAQLAAVAAAAEHHDQAVGVVLPQGFNQAFGGGFVVGIVDQDGELVADGHQLHTAFDERLFQSLMDGGIRKAQHLAHADGGQGVVNTEQPRHAHLYVQRVAVRLGQGELNAQHLLVAQQAVLLAGTVIHLGGMDAIGNQLAGVAFQQCFGVGVIGVYHADIAALEQLAFPAAVFLKAGMFAGADVVRVQVGEHAHFIMDARHAVHHNALAGNFHHAGIAPGIRQLAQDLLQLIALGGGVVQVIVVAGVIHAVGADHADLVTCGFQHSLDHVGGGGFALGAGHANHRHFQRGTAKIGGGKQCHGVTGALELDHGHIRQSGQHLGGQIVLDGQHGGAFGGNVRGVIMAVPLGADDADKQTARRYLAGIIVNVSHFGIQAALNKCIVQIFQQLF